MPGWNRETGCPIHCFSLVVCLQPATGLWLAVEESRNRGWWLPGGFVECGDNHYSTAIKETIEEAGIHVQVKGILRIENDMSVHGGRQRVIFYAEPSDPNQPVKTKPDRESNGAAWLTVSQLVEKAGKPPPEGLRGTELLEWARYIENGGTIYPLAVLQGERTPVPKGSQT